jgi:hypothetical protein
MCSFMIFQLIFTQNTEGGHKQFLYLHKTIFNDTPPTPSP